MMRVKNATRNGNKWSGIRAWWRRARSDWQGT